MNIFRPNYLLLFFGIFIWGCNQEKLLLSNPQDIQSDNYIIPPGELLLFSQDDHTVKITVIGDGTSFSAQISRKKSGDTQWNILVNNTELADTLVYFDSYILELNTTYVYQVRKILEGNISSAITDSITYQFLPPTLENIQQISDTKIEFNWMLPLQFVNDSTIKKVLITRLSGGLSKEFSVDPASSTFIDSTIYTNNVTYRYSLRSESLTGVISSRSEQHEVITSFPKIAAYQWLPLRLNQMQIDFDLETAQFDFIRTVVVQQSGDSSTIEEIIYRTSNPKSTVFQLTDILNEAQLDEKIWYKIKWCGDQYCDSLKFYAKTLPFRYMVYIPGSDSFTLGPDYNAGEDGKSVAITVSPFYADIYEMRETIIKSSGSEFPLKSTDLPVSNISWNDAVDFCNDRRDAHPAYSGQSNGVKKAAGFRLPTEVEWEYMASYGGQGAAKREYPWGNNISGYYANYYDSGDNKEPGLTPVGHYEARDAGSFFGLQDLAGNVMEWCQDWYNESAYENHNYAINPEGPASGEARVVRGGSWQSDAIDCNTRIRKEFSPTVSHETIGFRTVISAEPFLTIWRTQ